LDSWLYFIPPNLFISGPRKEWVFYENLPPATVVEWFKKFLDITTPPTQSLLGDLATYATDPKQKEDLNVLSQVPFLHSNFIAVKF
jgi:sulfite reductase alpha subunit-like flavoprotein